MRALVSAASWLGTAALITLLGALLLGRAAGVLPLIEQTGSMAPAIEPGDLLLVHTVSARTIARGDIVTFAHPHSPGRTLTHRVVKVQQRAGLLVITTRGDANPAPETWSVPPSGRLGTLVRVVPHVGRITRPVEDPRWRALLIMLLSTSSSIAMLRRIWRRLPKPPAPAR